MSTLGIKSRWAKAIGVLALLLVLAVPGCGDGDGSQNVEYSDSLTPSLTANEPTATSTPTPTYDVELSRKTLAIAKARWEVGGSADYDLESLVMCLCPESNSTLKIIVRSGAIESIVELESGRALSEREYVDAYTYHTISDRFDQIERALGLGGYVQPAYYLHVNYHPTLGYPTYLNVSYRYNVADYGFTLERLIYEPLDPSLPPATSTLSLDMEGRHASVLDLFSGRDDTVVEVLEKGLRLAGGRP